jgi:hypothetical protein
MCLHRGNRLNHHTHKEEHHHHDDDPSCHDHHHHHHPQQTGDSGLTARQKLIIRLEHALHHNSEHADFYEKLAEEAGKLEGDTVAQEIYEVARFALRQNKHIQRVLALLVPL